MNYVLDFINPTNNLANAIVGEGHNVAFSIGKNFDVYGYGLTFMAGFVLAILIYSLRLKFHYKVPFDPGFYYVFIAVPVILLGARVWSFAIGDAKIGTTGFFDFRSGGLAVQGGVIGGVIVALIWFPLILRKPKYHVRDVNADGEVYVRQVSVWVYADAIIPTILIGQALGRWGNFINGEIYGSETTPEALKWLQNSMPAVFEGMKHPIGDGSLFTIYHPLFLYESFFNVVFFTIIYFGLSYIKQLRIGVVACSYFVVYGIIRFITETARASQYRFAGTYVINSLLLVAGILGILYAQFVTRFTRDRFVLEAMFWWMNPSKNRRIYSFKDIRQEGEKLYYCNK
ncbi:prolipoprotein diacylglyceryl transferase [Ureaplasma miroungigenitalium]|uniref:prolipoprotein diacylglyceryl transferase n=1 Tax=Ureaplasma miroungigenitalium TaxID=1042321 RepID=UPI0021E89FD4|nr:prolipoprotein diacylglyceryl transferase [Ureaplasma miroungigenitalium]MCV3734320.1 prolipoprotein diacylglyceryl transferase [Ureaplasma miroungigenitalium]